ncbi:hypothetical protein B4U80_13443, partial [Leptotrombidium deliense]
MDTKKTKIAIGALALVCLILTFTLIGVAVNKKNSANDQNGGSFDFSEVCNSNECKAVEILTTDERLKEQSGAMKKANTFYDSCTALRIYVLYKQKIHNFLSDKNDIDALQELTDVMTENQDFPIFNENWNEDSFNWQSSYVYSDTNFGEQSFFNYTIDSFTRNASYIQITSPQYFLIAHITEDPRLSFKEKTDADETFRKTMKAYIQVLGITSSTTLSDNDIDNILDDVISFEKQLVRIGVPYYESIKESNKVEVNFTDVNAKFPDLNLENLLTQLFNTVNIKLNKNDTIQISDVTYFEQLGNVLKLTSKKTLANYMKLNILNSIAAIPISATILGLEPVQKAILCTTLTEQVFGLALSRFYVKYYLQDSTVQEMKAFVTELNRMISYIAVPSWVATDDDLDKVYGDMSIMQNYKFINNQRTAIGWLKKKLLKQIRPQNESIIDILKGNPSEVNAFNAFMENIFRVKIGILNQPFYYHNAPIGVNFGSIGYVLGHEILHGFDNEGAQHDYKGHKKMWWSNETWEVYQKKVKCFV